MKTGRWFSTSAACLAYASANLFLAPVATGQVVDEEGFYVAVRGYGAIEDENNLIFENSYEIAGAIGVRRHANWRFETEFSYRHSDIVGLNGGADIDGENTLRSLGLHAFYDFRNGRRLRPFLGAGVGLQHRKVSFSGVAENDPNFVLFADDAYPDVYANAFAGVSHHISQNLRLSVGGEYVTGRDRNIRANYRELPGINRSYNYYVGARWFFPQ